MYETQTKRETNELLPRQQLLYDARITVEITFLRTVSALKRKCWLLRLVFLQPSVSYEESVQRYQEGVSKIDIRNKFD